MATNRILREMVDIHYYGGHDGLAERRRMEDLCTARLTRAVEDLLDSWGIPEDQLVFIDRLQVNVAGINSFNIESELILKIVSALSTELEMKIGPPGVIKPGVSGPLSRSIFSEVIFFLQRGYLPWSSGIDNQWASAAAAVLSKLQVEDQRTLVAELKSADARQRFIRHFPAQTLEAILSLLTSDPEWWQLIVDVERLVEQLPESSRRTRLRERGLRILLEAVVFYEPANFVAVCQRLAEAFLQHEPTVVSAAIFECAQLGRAFNQIEAAKFPSAENTRLVAKAGAKSKPAAPVPRAPAPTAKKKIPVRGSGQDEDSIYIRNAGLVILAAYLPAFFKKLELADEERVLEVPTALALLHHLAFGSDECAEWDLVLNKILCGVPLQESVETPAPLTAEQKEEADRLLTAVIANWPALKNSSRDALRATFLQREGALCPQENGDWKLLLTRTSFDVLMDRLPWTISMIRLRWMPWMLYTDWAG